MAKTSRSTLQAEDIITDRLKGFYNDSWCVYWLHVPQHRGKHQGYIGVSRLNKAGLYLRYAMTTLAGVLSEVSYAYRPVYRMLAKFPSYKVTILHEGLTKEEALEVERRYRPRDNWDSVKNRYIDPYNWNMKIGG